MEQQQDTIFNFRFDETSKEHIRAIGQWATINAILAFVGLALNVIQFIVTSNAVYQRPSVFNMGLNPSSGASLVCQLAVSILLNVFLYNASVHLKRGVDNMDNGTLTRGFGFLRTYYKIYGIVLIVVMSLCLIGILFLSAFVH